MKKKIETLNTILLGNTLAALASSLDVGDGNDRLVVVLVGPWGVRLALADTISRPEAVGALYLAIDELNAMGDIL